MNWMILVGNGLGLTEPLSRHLPGTTEEKIDELNFGYFYRRRGMNREPPDYKISSNQLRQTFTATTHNIKGEP
jgi:hypothetical protein